MATSIPAPASPSSASQQPAAPTPVPSTLLARAATLRLDPLVLVGRSVARASGRPFWMIAEAGHPRRQWRSVFLGASGQLTCDCPHGSIARTCRHRAFVRTVLDEERRALEAIEARDRRDAERLGEASTVADNGAWARDRWSYENMGGALIDADRGWR